MESLSIIIIISLCFLLLLSAATQYISQYIKIPFTIFLVITGFLVAKLGLIFPDHLDFLNKFELHPDLIFYVCLPALIFESAFAMDAKLFRRNLLPILALAIPGLFISTALIAIIVYALSPLDLLSSLLLGAILSATDPVAVISLFKQLGVPNRLTVLVEGESLLNDSTAIVTAKVILAVIVAGTVGPHMFSHAVYDFAYEFIGGILFGIILTYVFANFIQLLRDELIAQLSMVVILGFLSFVIADEVFAVSGVMATITAGIMMAGWGRNKISVEAQHYVHKLLELLAYIANALIFLLVGFSVKLHTFDSAISIILITILAMTFARAIVIYTLIPLISRYTQVENISYGYQTIMWWGGLRGAIALAIVLSLTELPNQEILISVVMGAVLFTILVQGLTINKVIKIFKLDEPLIQDEVAKLEAQIAADNRSLQRLPQLLSGGMFSLRAAHQLEALCQKDTDQQRRKLKKIKEHDLNIDDESRLLYLNCYAIERHLFDEMYAKGYMSLQAYEELCFDMSREIDRMRYGGEVSQKVPLGFIKKSKDALFSIMLRYGILRSWVNRHNIYETIAFYQLQWGMHQGCTAALKYLGELDQHQTYKQVIIKAVRQQFIRWLNVTRKNLDQIAAQFPEFVEDMQSRLAQRMVLYAKQEEVRIRQHQGLLPENIASELDYQYTLAIRALQREHPEELQLDSHELLKRVPFFKEIPKSDVESIFSQLKEIHLLPGEYIIKEGESGKEMYMIMRGLIRVTKLIDGKEVEIATLMPGDFFGELVLLDDVKRQASCRAVTACLIYSLSREYFNELREHFPAINQAIDAEAQMRRD